MTQKRHAQPKKSSMHGGWIKGYSDTQARGELKFDRVMGAVPVLGARADGADWMRRLRDAALLDENGIALDDALKTIATL